MAGLVRSWTPVLAIAMVLAASMLVAADHPAHAGPATDTTGRAGPDTTTAALATVGATGWTSGRSVDAGAPAKRPDGGHAVPLAAGSASSTFGVLVVDGGEHQCSAAVVASDSRRLISTAAHCVWIEGQWTLDGAYFVPRFTTGREPWGRWAVEGAWVPRTWQEANSPIEDVASAHDVAFVRLAESPSGELAEDVLGSQGIWFGAPATSTVTAVGYPAAGAFDGQRLEACTGAAHVEQSAEQTSGKRDGSAGARAGGEVLVIDCDMTEGASGGPWLVGPRAQTGWGQVVGVISGGSGPELVSARFGPEAEEVYHAADTGADLEENDRQ